MTIRQVGGVFGRNPEFSTVGGVLTTAAQPNVTSLGVQTSDLAFASGKGIDFSGVGAAAETLDGYEEGLFYPDVTCSVTGFSSVTESAAGEYIKIGRAVYIYIFYRTDALSKGSASGDIRITNLPFVVRGGNTPTGRPLGLHAISIANSSATPFGLAAVPLIAETVPGTSEMRLLKRSAVDGAPSAMTDADVTSFSGTRIITFSGYYFTT